jgi:hypothetical protein
MHTLSTVCRRLVAAGLLSTGLAQAAVLYDPLSGTGSVDAADIRLALGWSDARFQAEAAGLGFGFRVQGVATVVCAWQLPGGSRGEERRRVEYAASGTLNSALRPDTRNPRLVAGITLTGVRQLQEEGLPKPRVGQPCVAPGGLPGTVQAVVPDTEQAQLWVQSGGTEVRLPF